MELYQKEQFVRELARGIVEGIVDDINHYKIPENWDGVELRCLLAERFNRSTYSGIGGKKRKAEYNNIILVNNL
jgi:hypothetical protein